MTIQLCLFCVLILESISGVLCSYEYSVGGIVAASAAGFLILVAIVIMIIVAVMWRDWYLRRQARRGRYRIPREKWRLFKDKTKKKSPSLVSTPRSERNMNMRMHNIAYTSGMPGSRVPTLNRQEPNTDAWITQLPPTNHYEEKTRTIKFDPEEDAVIVAEVLPDTTQPTQLRSTQLRSTQGRTVVMTTADMPHLGSTQTASYQTTIPNSSQMNTTYVPLNADNRPTMQMRQTTTDRVSYEPYHVQLQQLSQTSRPRTVQAQQLSQTARPRTGKDDIFITPLIPATNDNQEETGAGVVDFDSDDEAGNVPNSQSEDLVLF